MLGLGIAGLAISGASAAFSFIRAGRQNRMARAATIKAVDKMDDARKRTEMNKFGALGVQKDVYGAQRDSLTAAAAQLTQVAAEGDQRGIGATAGKIQAVQAQEQRKITQAQGKEALDIEKIKAAEEARLADERMKIDMGEANQMFGSANTFSSMAADSTAQGVSSLAAMGKQGIKLATQGYGGGSMKRGVNRLSKGADDYYKFDKDSDTYVEGAGLRQAILRANDPTAEGFGYERFQTMGADNQQYGEFVAGLRDETLSQTDFLSGVSKFYSPSDIEYLTEIYMNK